MNDLRTAAQQALAKPVEEPQGCYHCNHPLYAGIKCRLCGKVTEPAPPPDAQTEAEKVAYCAGWWAALEKARKAEPVQEPDSPERRCGGPGCDMRCCQPVQEPVAKCIDDICSEHLGRVEAFDHLPRGTILFTSPPQRKPLAEWQINDLMADIDPEDRDSWSFRQGVYAAEKHHGVRK